jgi:hypothetical protein
MSKKSRRARASQIVGVLALSTAAATAFAEPVSLTATCHLSSILPGDGECHIFYQLTDNFASPSEARQSQVRVDGKLVAQFVNDSANPVDFAVPFVSGTVKVQCGVNHTVGAQVAPLGTGAPAYEKVGTLPAIRCPAAQ